MRKKYLEILLTLMVVVILETACGTESSKVSYNLSKQANNFNVVRQITVIN